MRAAQLPYVPQPYPNEVMSSWLGRIASHYSTTWNNLKFFSTHEQKPIGDYGNTTETIQFLASVTGVEEERITALELSGAFPGQPEFRFSLHHSTERAAFNCCITCLREDWASGKDTYLRSEWAVAGVSHCHQHKTFLQGSCQQCMNTRRPAWGIAHGRARLFCQSCRKNLDDGIQYHGRSGWANGTLYRAMIETEVCLLKAMQGRAGKWPSSTNCEPEQFLRLFEDISYFSYRKTSSEFINACEDDYPIKWLAHMLGVRQMLKPYRGANYDHPLGDENVHVRAWRIAACLLILFPDDICKDGEELLSGFWPSLRWLYTTLTKPDREEFFKRAAQWPKRFSIEFDTDEDSKGNYIWNCDLEETTWSLRTLI